MSFKNKYLWFLVLTVIGYGLFEYYRPKPIDWNPTYTNKDKIPFGTKATYELLGDVFLQQKIQTVRVPIYNHLKDSKLSALSNYVFVCRDFAIDKNDRTQLLNYIAKGNHAFISAYYYPDSLMSQLGVKDELKAPTLRDTALVMNFVNPRIRTANGYVFRHDDGRNYFKVKKAEKVTVLAKNARNEPVFVKVAYGKGMIYLHNLPLSLTNYYVLDHQMSDFAFKSLSYLPNRPIYWDEYQKQGRFGEDEQSLLRYVMTQPALQWAYYIALALLVLFFGIY
jgi:hypothetical protein